MILARIAAVFAGRNAKASDFMLWPKEEKVEATAENVVRALKAMSKPKRKDKDGKRA